MASLAIVAKFFGLALSTLLPLVNPFGSALVVLGLVGERSAATYRGMAIKVAINSVLFLFVVELVGTAILSFFGISLPVVQISGGLVLAAMGWNLLNHRDVEVQSKTDAADASEGALAETTFYPLTFPVTVGPGSIVVMLTLSAHASTDQLLPMVLAHCGIGLAALILGVLVYVCYAYAPRIGRSVSPQTMQGILRVVAFVLLSIGVQITWNGVETLVKSLMHT